MYRYVSSSIIVSRRNIGRRSRRRIRVQVELRVGQCQNCNQNCEICRNAYECD
ncbi:hypothetical protein LSH36_700g01010 [Paralvinella palmiformis]|uniref:Uncharacterized protein n=1 Tax=Paralvinella palmiformis TaxID=53620 RepID=A0AAD9MV08_9ANNE|nr:hypothetical protein LSH36_700g01010 [Paralvinella palmiformis]